MRYPVRMIQDHQLPKGHDFVLLNIRGTFMWAVKRSALGPRTLAAMRRIEVAMAPRLAAI